MPLVASFVLAACLAVPLAGSAGHPFKESLVACTVLIERLIGEETQGPNPPEVLQMYDGAARAMRGEAERRGGLVCVRDVAAIERRDWHLRWDAGNWGVPENRGEVADWLTCCFKFAEHLGLEPIPADGS